MVHIIYILICSKQKVTQYVCVWYIFISLHLIIPLAISVDVIRYLKSIEIINAQAS